MEVIDHQPQTWFLLRDGGEYYLSVRCQQSFADFSILVRFSPAERDAYQTSGHAYADTLATAISGDPRGHRGRDLENELGSRVTQSVIAWRTKNEGDPGVQDAGQT
ncbi:MAG: hypothetical protein H7145_13970 [Akkermansiaceae bacterium]|nr:hypothetical protein [Armatimonadota bacterium]